MLTYFVVQAYGRTRMGALVSEAPILVQDASHALRMAERLAPSKAGVVAFTRSGDPCTGDYEEAKILTFFGEVPSLEHATSLAF